MRWSCVLVWLVACGGGGDSSVVDTQLDDTLHDTLHDSPEDAFVPPPPLPYVQQAYVKASNTDPEDGFGSAVAVSADGSTLAIGAFKESSAALGVDGDQADDTRPNSGAVYVFTRTGTAWAQQAYLKASNADAGDVFGRYLAISADGTTLAVGAPGEASGLVGVETDNTAPDAGAVYVFRRSGDTWAQEAYVKGSNSNTGDKFGFPFELSADGSTLAVGAEAEGSASTGVDGSQTNDQTAMGAVYVFSRTANVWSQQTYIKASNTNLTDFFCHVALSANGSTLAVGAVGEQSKATGVDGNQLDNSLFQAGAVYVYARTGISWSQQAYVKASNTGESDRFGIAVSLSGDGNVLAVGASGESGAGGDPANNAAPGAGAVYIFGRTGSTWSESAYLKASNASMGHQFGDSLMLTRDGTTLVVGAFSEASAATGVGGNGNDNSLFGAGAAYVFSGAGPNWSERAYLKASNTGMQDFFGRTQLAIADDGKTIVIGATGEDSAATGIDGDATDNTASGPGLTGAGAAYVFMLP